MATEQEQTFQVLQIAIQMETDGKKFYEQASLESVHELGRKLLANLAAEEDWHRRKFEEIYEAMRRQRAWPQTGFNPDKGRTISTIFARAAKETNKSTPSEVEAIRLAIEMETKSYEMYHGQAGTAGNDIVRQFYETLAAEERGHQLALADYLEFLRDPAGWFTTKERHSLDGG